MPNENEPILKQEEVEALLSGMSDGRISTESSSPPDEARRYEIGREVRILRGRMPTFDLSTRDFVDRSGRASYGRFADLRSCRWARSGP